MMLSQWVPASLLAMVASAANVATIVNLTDAAKTGAVCLDGSPTVLYTKPGAEPSKFVILQRGGGWCTSDDDCFSRSQTYLGSTNGYPSSIDLNGVVGQLYDEPWGQLSDDPAINPMMWNWTFIFLPYCDGGSLVGNRADPVLVGKSKIYYRGARIRAAVQEYLLKAAGLSSATDVVLVGGSAGALATYLHADAWAAALPSAAKVVAMPDSGFFLDYKLAPGGGYHTSMLWVYSAMNGTGAVPAACIEAHVADPSACIFAENVAPTLTTPTFALQSTYDAYQIVEELHANPSNPANYSAINAYGGQLSSLLTSRLLNSSTLHGAFLDSCYHHTRYWGNITIDGDLAASAFASWYGTLGVSGAKRSWVQGQVYPCKACCSNGQ